MNLFFCALMVMFTTGCNLNSPNQTEKPKQKAIQAEQVPNSCQALSDAIRDGDLDKQLKQLASCAESKEEGVTGFLLALLKQKNVDDSFKMDVIYALGEMKDPNAVQPLIALLQQDFKERTGITAAIIPTLGTLGDKAAVPVLLEALSKREDHWLYRNMAAQSLGEIGDPAAVQELIHASYMADTRDDAIQALSLMGDERSIPVFIEAISTEEEIETTEAALYGLKSIGTPAISEISMAITGFSSEYPDIGSRLLLVNLLGDIGSPEAKAALAQIGKRNNDPKITVEAQKVLENKKN